MVSSQPVVVLEGFDAVSRRLGGLSERLRNNILRGALRAMMRVYVVGLRRRTPVRSGALLRSIRSGARVFPAIHELAGSAGYGDGGANLRNYGGRYTYYGRFIESGAKGHWIPEGKNYASKRRDTKNLFIGGRWVTGPVWHPGIRAQRPVAQTREAETPAAQAVFRQYVDKRIAAYWATQGTA